MKKNNKLYRKLIKELLIHIVEVDQEVTKFANIVEENNVLFQFGVGINKEILPINKLIENLKIKEDSKRNQITDRLLDISENSRELEKDIKKFMKDYKI